MGREIRMVPPNWQHTKNRRGHEQPMYDERFEDRFARWLADFDRIRRGELEDIERKCYAKPGMDPLVEWSQDEGSIPDRAYYRPWRDDEATWFQVWETVTEGTPVTPAFATQAELVNWLVDKGECYGTQYARRFLREDAEAFVVRSRWVPSFVIQNGSIKQGIDSAGDLAKP